MTANDALVSVIVPAWNEEAHIGACLASLQAQDATFGFEIIVVDNESVDGTRQVAASCGVRVLTSGAGNPAGVRNAGIAAAQGRYLAFIDGDCLAPGDWLTRLVDWLERDPEVAAVGGPCLAPDDANWIVRAWGPPPAPIPPHPSPLVGANMFVRRSALDRVGIFDTSLTSAEDDEISRRLKAAGRVMSDPALAVVHLGYPDTLTAMFRKGLWHGSSQYRAHGFTGDKLLILTLLWSACVLGLLVAVVAGWHRLAGAFLVAALVILPAVFAAGRLRRVLAPARGRYLVPVGIMGIFVLAGRAVGLGRELARTIAGRDRGQA